MDRPSRLPQATASTSWIALVLATGCGAPCEHPAAPATPAASAIASSATAPEASGAAPAAPAPLGSGEVAPPPVASASASAPSAPAPSASAAPPPSAPAPAGSLPEVRVENVGLHVGGGPNDDATKEPFREAVATRFESFRRCYALVQEPEKGGTFGVDLRIGPRGGTPEVSQPRTGMKGAEFRDCVVGAFREVTFPPPRKGATVISYSLRFTLVGR
ncbi:MAG: hypothetical protein IT376_05210 [Polyangiaceae bacterium]|nr:hypothetical protein [Polyangiaceae bacterium]